MSRPGDLMWMVGLPAVSAAIAYGFSGSSGWIALAAALGLVTAASIVFVRIRPMVAVPVVIAAASGAYIGRTLVHILCLPGDCGFLEVVGGAVTAIGATAGVAVVVTLASRSFEEYHEATGRTVDTAATGKEPGEDS